MVAKSLQILVNCVANSLLRMVEKFKRLDRVPQPILQVFMGCGEGAMIIDGFEIDFLFLTISDFRDKSINSQAP